MADVKFIDQKKVRLLSGIVYNGGVYAKGSVLSVDEAYAKKLIAEGAAEAIAPEPTKPVVPPAKEKVEK